MGPEMKQILVLGIIQYAKNHDGFPTKDVSVIQAMIDAETAKGPAAGLDIHVFEIDPDLSDNMAKLREQFRSKRWDAVTIGGGVRFPKQLTQVFQDAVNMAIEEGPFKLVFPSMPDEIISRVVRALNGDEKR